MWAAWWDGASGRGRRVPGPAGRQRLSVAEKLSKIRVQTLVKEYLAAQELQLLGEVGMSDAIEMFVDKDDPHAIQT